MRTYWDIELHKNFGDRFEVMIHYISVPINSITHEYEIYDMPKVPLTAISEKIAEEILREISDTYHSYTVDNIMHCKLNAVHLSRGNSNNTFEDRLQMMVNKIIRRRINTHNSLSSVFEDTLKKYESPEAFGAHLKEEEQRKDEHGKWGLLLVDVYTGTLTEVTVETEQDNTLDNVLDKYLENGFECVTKKRLEEVLRSA